MMPEEIARVENGNSACGIPCGGMISSATVHCSGNAAWVLKNSREVFSVVLRSIDSGLSGEEIVGRVPSWFREACSAGGDP